jgi:hypothetical protein
MTVCPVSFEGALNPIEERIRQFLIERAKKCDPSRPFAAKVTYQDLCAAIDPDEHYFKWPRFRGIGPALGHVSTYEHNQGRPLLSALVVHSGNYEVGSGFAGLARALGEQVQPSAERAFWRSQVEAIVRYWTGPGKDEQAPDPVEKARALLATVSGEIEEIRRLLSTV